MLRLFAKRLVPRRSVGSGGSAINTQSPFSSKSQGKGKDARAPQDPPRNVPKGTFTLKWVLAGGPGGQNVNKLSTKAELRMNTNAGAQNIAWLPEAVRQRLVTGKAKNRINADGDLIIQNAETRKAKSNAERAEVGPEVA